MMTNSDMSREILIAYYSDDLHYVDLYFYPDANRYFLMGSKFESIEVDNKDGGMEKFRFEVFRSWMDKDDE